MMTFAIGYRIMSLESIFYDYVPPRRMVHQVIGKYKCFRNR